MPELRDVTAFATVTAQQLIYAAVEDRPGQLSIEAAMDHAASIAFAGVERYLDVKAGKYTVAGCNSWQEVVIAGARAKAAKLLSNDAPEEEGSSGATQPIWPRTPDRSGGHGLSVLYDQEELTDAALRFAHTLVDRYVTARDLWADIDRSDLEDLRSQAIERGVERFLRRYDPERGNKWQTYLWACICGCVHDVAHRRRQIICSEIGSEDMTLNTASATEDFTFEFLAMDGWAKLNLTPTMLQAYVHRAAGGAPGNKAENVAFSQACKRIRAHFGSLDELVGS